MSYIILTILCIFILQYIWKTINWVWFKPRKIEKLLRQQGLVGNTYKLLYGDLKVNSKLRHEAREKSIPFTNDYVARVFPFFHQLENKYGGICFSWMGPTPFINLTDPILLTDAFSRMHEFLKLQPNPLVASLACGLAHYEGDKWDMHRKLLNPAFQMHKLKMTLPAFYTSVVEIVNKWDNLLRTSSSREIDVYPYLTSLTGDVISRIAFGSTYVEGRKIFELIHEQQKCIAPLVNSIYISGWKYVPTKTNKMIRDKNAEIENLLKKIIDKKVKAMKNGEGSKDDVLEILIESTSKKEKKLRMSFRDLIEECKLFYFVGHESTSLLLVWTMILLSKHQDWQNRAREEVLATFGANPPDFEGLNRLKIIKMIIHEVSRLYPPVPSVIRRIKAGGATLGGLYLPEGVLLGMSIIHAHHNPKYWGEDAKEFKPERFSDGVGKATNGTNTFLPFGWGLRNCIGQNLALIETKMALSVFLQKFAFELSPSYSHAPTGVITLKPQHGAHLILRRV
ncbi:cytochrome P450 72A397-like [Silene latifolia]|uniref:cytochrome P450 72A397-like n=1 Tax=Silene latifolia TaxID=37657 RepID=UPI003D783BCC